MKLRFLSLFSGIEAASLAWSELGWECAGVSEIEPFACAALRHHYPHVPNLGDVTAITEDQVAALGHLDVLIFGSPCQDLSLAGKRAGLAGARSSLFYDAARVIRWARAHCGLRFALWENVPGALSSNEGRDFALVVGELAGCELAVPVECWGSEGVALGDDALVEWGVLDAQWFGLAQRRDRLFALADFGAWASRAPVLLEPESSRGDSPPSRTPGQSIAGTLTPSSLGRSSATGGDGREGMMVPQAFDVANTLTHRMHKGINTTVDEGQTPILSLEVAHSLRADGFDASEDGSGRGTPIVPEVAHPLMAGQNETGGNRYPGMTADSAAGSLIAFDCKASGRGGFSAGDVSPTLRAMSAAGGNQNAGCQVATLEGASVRRLTPRECERLQGMPDDYTLVPYRGKLAKDGPRYKSLGNSMAVLVIRWIGRRIEAVLG